MPKQITIKDLLFVGLGKYVLALYRETGTIVWQNDELNRGYTTLLLDGDKLMVSSNGYIYCLDPRDGKILWHNPLTGYGMGAASLVSVRGRSSEDNVRFEAESDASRSSDPAPTPAT